MMHMVEAKVSINFGSLAFFTLFDFFLFAVREEVHF